MDVELVTDAASDDENFGFDDNSEDYLNYEGERCGICMDVVIDRGVLDCCQHWFCFPCIDNWATITSLCPLCQNEFQLITCVPVHDTVGGTQTDDETNPRDDDWFIEGKTNTLSFPSYYIDENAVACLDGDGCKIRSVSVEIGEDSDIDTSIACDSCDKWYHAFCVGFDPEGTCEGSWLCPGCTVGKVPQMSDGASVSSKDNQNGVEIAGGNYLAEQSFSGRVSVSVADDGETAVVISLVEGNQKSQQSGESIGGFSKDMDNNLSSSSTFSTLNSDALPDFRKSLNPDSCQQETEVYLSRHNCHTALHLLSPAELKICADDTVERAPTHPNNDMTMCSFGLDPDMKNNDLSEGHVAGSLEVNNRSEDLLPAVNVEAIGAEALPMKSMMPDVKQATSGTTGPKRKHGERRIVGHGEREAKLSQKKIKTQIAGQPINPTNQTAASFVDESNTISAQRSLDDSECLSEKDNGTPDIMDIVQETDRRALKQSGCKNASDINPKEKETAAVLRLKKIMRRAGDNKDSMVLVQELRKKIREAVRNKSSEEVGQNLFDPKLLDAFRAALAGSGAENRKPVIDMKAKRSLLQKGKVRESLTKKIYGAGGKRKRAWTRECEVEFWKHRCLKASKPEKLQALKSVLDVLRDDSSHTKKMPGDDQEARGSILSRLYLADTSVFPRKNDIKPVSALNALSTSEQKRESGFTENASKLQPNNLSDISLQKYNALSEAIVLPSDPKGVKSEATSSDTQVRRHPKGTPTSGKVLASKPDSIKGDRRKWALELLARKTAASGKNMQEKEEDTLILKGNYPLLAQLQKDMRPVLAPSRHNKIPTSVRQAQIYRLTEHFLRKANLSVVSQTAETELAVADAVNIEKDIANRSNSKLVYVNLCSQELSRRSEDINSDRAKEADPCSTSGCSSVEASGEETINSSLDLSVDEALKKAGLMSDSPPNSPSHLTDAVDNQVGSPEDIDEEPDNVIEVDSQPDLDIYGDFEYSLEDDDFIGASVLNTSKQESEPPKMKMLFSSLKTEKPNRIPDPDLGDHEVRRDVDPLTGSSDLLESQNNPSTGGSAVDSTVDNCVVRKSSDDNDNELSLAECEELYGPDIEPLIEKYPEAASAMPFGHKHGENEDNKSNHADKRAAKEESNQPSSSADKRENADTKEKAAKCDTKQSENYKTVMKKVETYIKEHIRPLCKSGVITVEQYCWAVGKTTEKVMKYHSKEKNANFLIKEGDKVKKLAEQYVEASQQKTKS